MLGRRSFRALRQALDNGHRAALVRQYRATIISQWLLVAALAAIWMSYERDVATLGLVAPWIDGSSSMIAAGSSVFLITVFIKQALIAHRLDEATRRRVREQLGPALVILPTNASEHRWFCLVAVTAGICEELLYRGFLIVYLSAWVGPWTCVGVAAMAFGLAHGYQGPNGMIKTTVLGVIAGAIYQSTGSLLLPIVLHVVIDLQAGAIGRNVGCDLTDASTGSPPTP